jgi:hypothetical protein
MFSEVIEVSKIFTLKQLKIDEDFIIQINKKLKFKDLKEYFEVRENGEPIIFELIKKNYVTPAIYIKFYEKILTIQNKDVILYNNEYKKFQYSMKMIKKTIQGGLDDEA